MHKNISLKFRSKKGFSLLEFLIYSAISAIVSLSIGGVFLATVQGRFQSQARGDLGSTIMFVSERIKQDLKNATYITTPANNRTASTLALIVNGSTVIYTINDSKVTRQVNSEPAVVLTPPNVNFTADNFKFSHIENINLPLLKVFVSVQVYIKATSTNSTQTYSEERQFTTRLGAILSTPSRGNGATDGVSPWSPPIL